MRGGLAGKAALITGAARRIGRATALELARAGCDVAVHYRTSKADAERLAAAIHESGHRAILLCADLADPEQVRTLPGRVLSEWGRLDILVNNASVFNRMTLAEFDLTEWNHTMMVNLAAPVLLSHTAAPHMQAGGTIVNLCDIASERPWPSSLAYCASKAGLVAMTRALARELAPRIRVNAVSPGVAEWPEDFSETQKAALLARIPARRAGTAEDIAAAVTFLARDASYLTGVVLGVDGGRGIAW